MKPKLILLCVLFVYSNLFAQNFEFTFENNTSTAIGQIFCSPQSAENEWSNNLVDNFIEPGESVNIVFQSQYDDCLFNFWAVGINDNNYINLSQDLCQSNYVLMSEINLEDNRGDEVEIDGDIRDVITYNTWRIVYDGNDYGTLKLDSDGTAHKTGTGGSMPTDGNWSLDETGYYLTLHFPDEGQAMIGTLKYRGNEMELSFYDGSIIWQLVAM